MSYTTLLLLADGRFPAGSHAHSSGLEAAVSAGRVADIPGLEAFLCGRLVTAGLVAAAFAAASHCGAHDLSTLEEEFDARTPSPALRLASRRQGRALLRAGRAVWPLHPAMAAASRYKEQDDRIALHHPVALGLVASAAGLTGIQAAHVAAYMVLTGPANAAVRLLGLDPFQVQHMLARLAIVCDGVAESAATYADKPPSELPASSSPLDAIAAEVHATWEVRLFAS